jgi:hypothetical protein
MTDVTHDRLRVFAGNANPELALEICQKLKSGKVFVVPGAFYKTIVMLEKIVPRWVRSAAIVGAGKRKAQ